MSRNLLLTVGNGMMGDDGAGALLAQRLRQHPLKGWEVLNGGSAPENVLHQARQLSPELVLLVDATEMDLPPGSVRRIPEERLEDPFLFTTHTLPLTFLIQALREFAPRVEFIGIQPETVAFGYPISPAVQEAVAQVYQQLQDGSFEWESL
jgi:hydrogenase 3 maturation protease